MRELQSSGAPGSGEDSVQHLHLLPTQTAQCPSKSCCTQTLLCLSPYGNGALATQPGILSPHSSSLPGLSLLPRCSALTQARSSAALSDNSSKPRHSLQGVLLCPCCGNTRSTQVPAMLILAPEWGKEWNRKKLYQ